MKACIVTISTTIDGQENSVSRRGEMALSALEAKVCYREENAEVTLILKNEVLTVLREGDYSLRLQLKEGETLNGSLGFGGTTGDIGMQTQKLAYSTTKNSLMLLAYYTILAGGEPQDTKIRLQAKEL